MDHNNVWIIYPEYFDYRLSRRLGRKVPLKYALISPKLDEITEALKKLKVPILNVEYDKYHPANWIEHKGRVTIIKLPKTSKRHFLIEVAKMLIQVRKRREAMKKLEKSKKRSKDIEKYLERVVKKGKRK